MLQIILFCICLFLFVWYYNNVEVGKGPPIYKGRLPILGHAHLLLKCRTHEGLMDLFNGFTKECERLGGVMRWSFGPSQFYWITNPEDAFRIGKANVTKHPFYEFSEKLLGRGLVTDSGLSWKKHKKLLNPAFSWKVLSKNPAKLNMETRKFLINFDSKVGKGPIDCYQDIKLMALITVFSTLFPSFEKDEKFAKLYIENIDEALEILITRFRTIFYHWNFIYKFSNLSRKEQAVMQTIDKCLEEMIERKQEMNKTETDKKASAIQNKVFLDILLELYNKGKYTMQEIKDEINTFVIAAFDTTSCAVNNILVLLGTRLDVQDKVFEELTKVLGTDDRDVDKQDLHYLSYLEAVIMEYLRLHPPSPLSFRTIDEAIHLSKYTLPAGTSCVLALNGVNRDPWWGPDRHEFRPERWFEREDLSHYFAGFGAGRRICIGKVYAMMSMKTMLAHILRRYRVTADGSQLKFKYDFVMKPVSGHFIGLERRI